ncbi:MAG: acetolactate decarboxylase [Desulfobaccales bacterium]
MKIRRSTLIYALLIWLLTCVAGQAADRKVLFQTSTIQALMNGVYDSGYSFANLERHGDFGVGTFQTLDGEMVAVDGRFYQVKTDGAAYPVAPTQKTPFSEVTFFRADKTLNLTEPLDLKQLEQYLTDHLPSRNFPYAIKVTGNFSLIRTRSVPSQARPYPPLAAVVKSQEVFEFREVDGVIVGFYHPNYMAGINVAGYHLHFLTRDRRAGGHLLDCRIKEARVELERMDEVYLRLPGNAAFCQTDLSGDKRQEIEKVEK